MIKIYHFRKPKFYCQDCGRRLKETENELFYYCKKCNKEIQILKPATKLEERIKKKAERLSKMW